MSATPLAPPVEPRDDGPPDGPVPLGQRLYDNVFLLLGVGIVIMVLVYTGWGLVELAMLPQATLP